jgi:hypothetical protein
MAAEVAQLSVVIKGDDHDAENKIKGVNEHVQQFAGFFKTALSSALGFAGGEAGHMRRCNTTAEVRGFRYGLGDAAARWQLLYALPPCEWAGGARVRGHGGDRRDCRATRRTDGRRAADTADCHTTSGGTAASARRGDGRSLSAYACRSERGAHGGWLPPAPSRRMEEAT